jgi:hypothetical protein
MLREGTYYKGLYRVDPNKIPETTKRNTAFVISQEEREPTDQKHPLLALRLENLD